MIIQQGRTVDKNLVEMTKGMKRDMIRFGAEQILSSADGSGVIDIDIDMILKKGEEKTAEENTKYAKLGESELRNLTLEEASSVSLYQFDGVDFRTQQKKSDDPFDYDFRQRKPVQYFNIQDTPSPAFSNPTKETPPKLRLLPDHHFYPKKLRDMCESDGRINMSIDRNFKKNLISQGFTNWTRHDLKLWVNFKI